MILHFSDIKKSPVSTSASAYLQPEIWTWKSENRPKVDQRCVRKQPWNSPQCGTLTLQILCRLNKTWYNMITQRFGGEFERTMLCLAIVRIAVPPPPSSLSDLISCATYLYVSGFNFLIKTVAKKAKIEFFMASINYTVFDRAKGVLACMQWCCMDQLNLRAALGSGNSKHSALQAICLNKKEHVFTIWTVHITWFPMEHFWRMSIMGKLWK